MAGGVGNELFLTGVAVVDGLAGDPGCVSGQLLYQDVLLAAVAAAHTLLDDVDLVLGDAADPAADAAQMVGNLGGGIDHQAAVLHMGIADVGLQGGVLDLAGLVGVLYNGIGLCKALLHIADVALVGGGDVLLDVGVEGELVDHLALTLVTGTGIVLV